MLNSSDGEARRRHRLRQDVRALILRPVTAALAPRHHLHNIKSSARLSAQSSAFQFYLANQLRLQHLVPAQSTSSSTRAARWGQDSGYSEDLSKANYGFERSRARQETR